MEIEESKEEKAENIKKTEKKRKEKGIVDTISPGSGPAVKSMTLKLEVLESAIS